MIPFRVAFASILFVACGGGVAPQQPLTGVVEVSAGESHACARLVNGRVACWGSNQFGQAGQPHSNIDGNFVKVATVVPGLDGVTSVVAGATWNCAIIAEGRVACWGSNFSGELGSRPPLEEAQSARPVLVPGVQGATAVVTLKSLGVTARTHAATCAIGADGRATCWGGIVPRVEEFSNARPPQPLNGVVSAKGLAVSVAAGCELRGDGSVACWGEGTSNGQVNEAGFPQSATEPIIVPGLTGVSALVAPAEQMCVVRGTKDLACWLLASGTLGAVPPTGAVAPIVPIDGISDVASVAAYGWFVYVATMSGRVFYVNPFLRSTGVATAAGIESAVSVAAGNEFACAVLRDGTVRCWGRNLFYHLGNGDSEGEWWSERPTTVQAAPTPGDAGPN